MNVNIIGLLQNLAVLDSISIWAAIATVVIGSIGLKLGRDTLEETRASNSLAAEKQCSLRAHYASGSLKLVSENVNIGLHAVHLLPADSDEAFRDEWESQPKLPLHHGTELIDGEPLRIDIPEGLKAHFEDPLGSPKLGLVFHLFDHRERTRIIPVTWKGGKP